MRHRLVTEQDGKQHVSSVIVPLEEVPFALDYEQMIHAAAGWDTRRYGNMLRVHRNGSTRWIWVRARNPMEDTL